jgi:hypothetical protein
MRVLAFQRVRIALDLVCLDKHLSGPYTGPLIQTRFTSVTWSTRPRADDTRYAPETAL